MTQSPRPLALVTGASTGIGLELARHSASQGFDLVIVADEPAIRTAANSLRADGGMVEAVEADLSTTEGVDRLLDKVREIGRPVDVLMANAGRGLGGDFLDQSFEDIMKVVNTNITGTLYLIQEVARTMRVRGEGRILITGSVAGFLPGTYQAVYNGTKAFLDNFAFALRHELDDEGVTVTCLMPGPTETEFFARADMLDTRVGQSKKDDPAMVARVGFDAMMRGDGDVVSGWSNKIQTTLANVVPAGMMAKVHERMAEPGSGKA
ncbi:SDR family NAD(P)-dependent oxidoreductase [Chthonobacter rhizosphaerae]|uniref:SDR family NAD(P)-dependent oxidoreductase n=1 Tax=Chthonobacter rhizosphaerae TaxID=2735553 RepID=UPI0015EF73C2|nr:SDR family NAD(P)-dependent oxidoreductase [Chthonobacter rhizosphaerae]